jgi:hypothetical protein
MAFETGLAKALANVVHMTAVGIVIGSPVSGSPRTDEVLDVWRDFGRDSM